MQFFKLSVFMALVAAAIATPIELQSRSLFGCYRDVAATQVDCLEACGDTSATDCTNAWYVQEQDAKIAPIWSCDTEFLIFVAPLLRPRAT